MKKIIKLAAIAAMCLSLASCEDFLNYLSTVASFQYSANVAYDGQNMVLKRTATCAYLWSVPQGSSFCSVKVYTGEESRKINGQDSTAVASFYLDLSSNEIEKVTIKAQNMLYPDNQDYTTEESIEIHRWGIRVKDCASGVDVTSLKADTEYMAYVYDAKTKEPIDKIIFNLAVSQNNRAEEKIEFSSTLGDIFLPADENPEYNPNVAAKFKFTSSQAKSFSNIRLQAKLNGVIMFADLNKE